MHAHTHWHTHHHFLISNALPANYGFNLNRKCAAKSHYSYNPRRNCTESSSNVALNAKANMAKYIENPYCLTSHSPTQLKGKRTLLQLWIYWHWDSYCWLLQKTVYDWGHVSTDGQLGLNQLGMLNLNYSQGHNNTDCTPLLMNWRDPR